MRVSLIAAVADDGVIGRDRDLPWRLPADWRRFKRLTMGHHLLMGRRTWESIARPLPGRTIVVISRGAPELPAGVHLAASLDDALALARRTGDDEAFIAGGAQIYRLALPLADRLYLTRVHATFDGDTRFPPWNTSTWRLTASEDHPADAQNPHPVTFETWERPEPWGGHKKQADERHIQVEPRKGLQPPVDRKHRKRAEEDPGRARRALDKPENEP